MAMHNPPHPGEFITQVYLEPNNLSARELSAKLSVSASTLHRILIGTSAVSPEMALRLATVVAVYRGSEVVDRAGGTPVSAADEATQLFRDLEASIHASLPPAPNLRFEGEPVDGPAPPSNSPRLDDHAEQPTWRSLAFES